MPEKLYTCEELAEKYKVKIRTVWSWVRSGKLPAVKIGRLYRVYERDVVAFEQANFIKS